VVEDEPYFLTVIRYIHQNPIKAGLCQCISEYKHSSYGEYITEDSRLVDVSFALSIADKDSFIILNNVGTMDCYMDVSDEVHKINVVDRAAIMQWVSNCASSAEFQSLDASQRVRSIEGLRQRGLSIRQIGRLTGVSFGIVRNQ